MSLKIVATLFSLVATVIGATADAPASAVLAARADCDIDGAVPFFRAYSSADTDHFYTTDYSEMKNAITNLTYSYESNMGLVFRLPTVSTAILYRLYLPTSIDHFYTTNQSEANHAVQELGYFDEGTSAYVFQTQVCASVPLYRLYDASITDHFYTTSESERENAINVLGIRMRGSRAMSCRTFDVEGSSSGGGFQHPPASCLRDADAFFRP
ncbi:uncharacterized protein B0H18DRAFT_1215844 [Fomitopsis serialis]|uniref:uncharacterized protein n=1 Tax=Fomitopsis serialis TaxID=139415 RepID=UPI002007DF2F|nr:uncharacterized protein B0H18DRAFT_1215844 [Neoantrodia serialis]KAH9914688.1 hypothetical protein B0H18DRAFT_1215844 [Neoantrodia serialis]